MSTNNYSNFDLERFSSDISGQIDYSDDSNPFPISAFPLTFRRVISDLKTSLNFKDDYVGTALIAAMASVVGTSVKLRVKDNWYEYASFYLCIIGNSGSSKSHPVNLIFKSIRAFDAKNHQRYVEDYTTYESSQKTYKKDSDYVENIAKPTLSKIVMDNFTPEVLMRRLSENPKGLCVISDEISSFLEGMNDYSKSDQSSKYLSIWSNQPTTTDRIGVPIPLLIPTPCLSIIGGLQPRLLAKMFPSQKLDSGFFPRFLFAYPDAVKKMPINDNAVDEATLKDLNSFITDYLTRSNVTEIDGVLNSRVLNWSPDAKDFFYHWQSQNCDRVNDCEGTVTSEVIGKFDIHFIRLSLILQMMADPTSNLIQIEAVKGAKMLCEYFLNCSLKVLSHILKPDHYLTTLPENKNIFYAKLSENFKTGEAVNLGLQFGILERAVKEFLKDQTLFKKTSHGNYQKVLKN